MTKSNKPVIRTGKPGRPRANVGKIKHRPNPNGRPTKYHENFPQIVFYMRALGKKDTEIIERLKVSETVFYEWLRKKPEFRKAYDDGKHNLDDIAAQGLAIKMQPRKIKTIEHKEYVDKMGNVQKLKTEKIQELDIDPLVLNNYSNRRISSFKIDLIEDPNNEKVDQLLKALAELRPEAMQIALDERAQRLAKKTVDGLTIEVKPEEDGGDSNSNNNLPP